MRNSKFSIVIPTRNRAETLKYTIETCLAQDYSDFEVIIQDNCSSADTKETVERFTDSRISYFRSDIPLSMSRNWEQAITHVSGDYVIVIGDDDALLFHALKTLNRLLQTTPVPVIRWERVYYSWPNIPITSEANKIYFPLSQNIKANINGHALITSLCDYNSDYTLLPMLYNSAVSIDLIEHLRHATGYVFAGISPDIYSGLAFAYMTGNYLSLGIPMSINAGSAKSNGIATHTASCNKNSIAEEFYQLNKGDFNKPAFIPEVPVIWATIAENLVSFIQLLCPHEPSFTINVTRLVQLCVHQLVTMAPNDEWLHKNLDLVYRAAQEDAAASRWFEENIKIPHLHCISPEKPLWLRGFQKGRLNIDASDFGITNVYDVCRLYQKIFGNAEELFI